MFCLPPSVVRTGLHAHRGTSWVSPVFPFSPWYYCIRVFISAWRSIRIQFFSIRLYFHLEGLIWPRSTSVYVCMHVRTSKYVFMPFFSNNGLHNTTCDANIIRMHHEPIMNSWWNVPGCTHRNTGGTVQPPTRLLRWMRGKVRKNNTTMNSWYILRLLDRALVCQILLTGYIRYHLFMFFIFNLSVSIQVQRHTCNQCIYR